MAADMGAEDQPSCSCSSSSAGDDGSSSGHLLYTSLEHFNASRRRRRRPSIILGALLALFLASGSGVALAVVLMLQDDEPPPTATTKNTTTEVQTRHIACLARDLVLFASLLALLYLALHVRGALRRDHHRGGSYTSSGREQEQEGRSSRVSSRVMRSSPSGPPHTMRGDFLHAGALLVSRLAIGVWVAALAATAVLIARAGRGAGVEGDGGRGMLGAGVVGAAPVLELLVCTFAIPSFVIISAMIERHHSPFATTGLSQASFLTCRVSAFADDLAAAEGDSEAGMLSISRRASLMERQRRVNNSNNRCNEESSATAVTLTSTEIIRQGAPGGSTAPAQNRKDSNGPGGPREVTNDKMNTNTKVLANLSGKTCDRIPPPLKPLGPRPQALPVSVPAQHSPPQPAYNPGGWRSEWNNVTEQVDVPRTTTDTEASSSPSSPSSSYSSSSSTGEASSNGSNGSSFAVPASTYVSSRYSSRYSKDSSSSVLRPSSSAPVSGSGRWAESGPSKPSAHPKEQAKQKRRPPPAPSTSIASSEKRTGLSTVRYAAKPDVAVRQPVRVVPALGSSSNGGGKLAALTYSPATMVDTDTDTDCGGNVWGRTGEVKEKAKGKMAGEEQGTGEGAVDGLVRAKPTAVSVLRGAQRAQKRGNVQKAEKIQGRASARGFWGMRRSRSEDDGVKPSKEGKEAGAEVKVPGAFVDEG
ncbi:hypothetical protein DL768_007922 [Monosporascus sp. mg162]|nr:hypothetical protein DL768_007922 [Monosporascus sp. mg162]